MEQIRFKLGERMPFISTRSFALGNTGITVPSGADLLFDGSTVEYAGAEYPFPQLRGAIRAGWAVPADQYEEGNPEYGRKVRANIQVRHPTQGGNPMAPNSSQQTQRMSIATTESDERVVGNTATHANQTRTANNGYQRGKPINVVQAGETVRGQHGFEVVEDQDGVEVPGRSLKTAAGEKAKQSRTVLTSETAATAVRKASDVQIEPGKGITEEEMLERMPEEERELYLAEKESLKSRYVNEPPLARQRVATVKTAKQGQAEGMSFTTQVGGGVEIADPSGLGGKATESTITEDGITFRNTNGPSQRAQGVQPARRPVQAASQPAPTPRAAAPAVQLPEEVRRRIAKAVCPDFPDNYDFNAPAKKKLARLQADYEDRADVLQAVYASESEDFKAVVANEFPQAFGG